MPRVAKSVGFIFEGTYFHDLISVCSLMRATRFATKIGNRFVSLCIICNAAVESVQYTDLELGNFSSFCTIWQSQTDNTAAVNSSLGIETALIGATQALPITNEQWILSLQLISLR